MKFKQTLFSLLLATSLHQNVIASPFDELQANPDLQNVSAIFECLKDNFQDMELVKTKLDENSKHIPVVKEHRLSQEMNRTSLEVQRKSLEKVYKSLKEMLLTKFSTQEIDQNSFDQAKKLSAGPQLFGGHIPIIITQDGRYSIGSISSGGAVHINTQDTKFSAKNNDPFFTIQTNDQWTILYKDPTTTKLQCTLSSPSYLLIRDPIPTSDVFMDSLPEPDILQEKLKTSSEGTQEAYGLLSQIGTRTQEIIAINSQLQLLSQENTVVEIPQELEDFSALPNFIDHYEQELQKDLTMKRQARLEAEQQLNSVSYFYIDEASQLMVQALGLKSFTLQTTEEGLLYSSMPSIHVIAPNYIDIPIEIHRILAAFLPSKLIYLGVDSRAAVLKFAPNHHPLLDIKNGEVSVSFIDRTVNDANQVGSSSLRGVLSEYTTEKIATENTDNKR